uniref:Uncharacterized protein n=1 Tax=Mesocestoides corti TaxID=53468 RepID=A0A5K3EU53_MESCO
MRYHWTLLWHEGVPQRSLPEMQAGEQGTSFLNVCCSFVSSPVSTSTQLQAVVSN